VWKIVADDPFEHRAHNSAMRKRGETKGRYALRKTRGEEAEFDSFSNQ